VTHLSHNNSSVRVRCPQELKDAVEAKAAAEFLTVSAFIRRLLAGETQAKFAQPRNATEPAA
jgi:predicted DNA binding CopG/RHH family protein